MFAAIFYLIVLIFLFYILAKICDQYFIQSLDIISSKLNLSQSVAGASFMAIGTSAPEFFTSVIALTKVGSENIGAGTIVGSAIFNILVIVGFSAIVSTAFLSWKPVVRDMGFYVVSILVLFFTFNDGIVTLYEASMYLVVYSFYIFILSKWSKWFPEVSTIDEGEELVREMQREDKLLKKNSKLISRILLLIDNLLSLFFPDLNKKPQLFWLTFIVSISLIILSSWGLVESAVSFANIVGIPEVIVALTILAAGTSVPDLLASVIVAKKGRGDMAISNAVGSNTFDILIALGLPWFFYIVYTGRSVVVGIENLTSSILLLFFTVVAIFFVLLVQKFKIGKKSGYFLVALYIMYVFYSVISIQS